MFPKFLILSIFVLISITDGKIVKVNKIVRKTFVKHPEITILKGKDKASPITDEVVKVQLYYECLCPYSREFYTKAFMDTVLELNSYLNVSTYPYGNAKTIDNGGGNYTITCQHGPRECYGNKLHACAIDALQTITLAELYNSCMMELSRNPGSDDAAADACGIPLNIDSAPIKACAKGAKGIQLLKYYGDESKKAAFQYVPYVVINGAVMNPDDDFKQSVCKAFKNPPKECKQ